MCFNEGPLKAKIPGSQASHAALGLPFCPLLPAPASLVGCLILPLPRAHAGHHLRVWDFAIGNCWGPGSEMPVWSL